ncbi:MAG: hypothetical protein J6A89_04120 [Clostridia bacterium]|nr:hypothetical protein [Clostridia bacterium]
MAKRAEKKNEKIVKEKYISVRKRKWVDLEDNNYPYKQGDIYPREGLVVSEERIKELSTINNKLGEVLIQKVEIEETKDLADINNEEDSNKDENENIEDVTDSDKDENENTEDVTDSDKNETENTNNGEITKTEE